jgi:hypothetical protein
VKNELSGLLTLTFIIAAIMICGCTSTPQESNTVTPTTTTLPNLPETTVTAPITEMPAPTITDDITAQQLLIDEDWREIQVQWDIYVDDKNRLFREEITSDDINIYRRTINPDATTIFTNLKSEIGKIESSNTKIIQAKENLTIICNYKIYRLEASSAYYHAYQMSPTDKEKAKEEYRNAKYAYQNALGIINSFDENSPYYPYISPDIADLVSFIATIDQKLAELSS